MSLLICKECGKQFSSWASSCPNCGYPNPPAAPGKRIQSVQYTRLSPTEEAENRSCDKVSRDEAIKCLRYAKEVEATLYTYRIACRRLGMRINSLGTGEKTQPPQKDSGSFPFGPVFLSVYFALNLTGCIVLTGVFAPFVSSQKALSDFFREEVWIMLLSMCTAAAGAWLSSLLIWGICAVIKKSKYRRLMRKYHALESQQQARREEENATKAILKRQQTVLVKEILRNKALLERLYGLNIILPEFRHLVAVATLLEYLEEGKCVSLTGTNGAYNTYMEAEKQGLIAGKLENAVKMHLELRSVQYLLFEEIQSAGATAGRICACADREEPTDNPELAAYVNSVAHRNAEITAYLDAAE